jgi:replication fork protection complex subunit Csm3/Swi3
MLNLYQLWLDDLYPKAKFKDGLTMVEKLGHTKRMQVSRRAWIDESKGFRRREDGDVEMRLGDAGQAQDDNDEIFPIPTNMNESARRQGQREGGADGPDEDELDALLGGEAPVAAVPIRPANNGPPESQGPFRDDELDALLNEEPQQAAQPRQQTTKQKGPFEDDNDDDDLDALLAEEPQTSGNDNGGESSKAIGSQHPTNTGKDIDFADDEEAMAEMGW